MSIQFQSLNVKKLLRKIAKAQKKFEAKQQKLFDLLDDNLTVGSRVTWQDGGNEITGTIVTSGDANLISVMMDEGCLPEFVTKMSTSKRLAARKCMVKISDLTSIKMFYEDDGEADGTT